MKSWFIEGILEKKCPKDWTKIKKKNKKKWVIYLLKIASTRLMIAPTTTIQPAITVITAGIPGITNTPSIIPEPTANETRIPTIHVITPIKLSLIFYLLFGFFFLLCIAKILLQQQKL